MGIIISSCLNESEAEVVPVNQVRRIFYGTVLADLTARSLRLIIFICRD